jgi:hypothetical protein
MDHRYSIIIVVIIAVSLPIGQSSNPPLTPIQLITTNKYVAEEHKVTTRDGYILSMQRIPYGRSGKPSELSELIVNLLFFNINNYYVQCILYIIHVRLF